MSEEDLIGCTDANQCLDILTILSKTIPLANLRSLFETENDQYLLQLFSRLKPTIENLITYILIQKFFRFARSENFTAAMSFEKQIDINSHDLTPIRNELESHILITKYNLSKSYQAGNMNKTVSSICFNFIHGLLNNSN